MVKKSCCIFLVAAMLFMQIGCASTYPPQNQYASKSVESHLIEQPAGNEIRAKVFDVKLDEVRQKTKRYLPTGTGADSILQDAGQLQKVTEDHYRKLARMPRRGALVGGALAGVSCVAYWVSADKKDDHFIGKVFTWSAAAMLTPIAALGGALGGAFIGSLFVVGKVNNPVPMKAADGLNKLIGRYNSCVTRPVQSDSSTVIQQ
jgi:hypothetical protein